MWSAGGADDKERFLADLRALRDTAALEFDELAARAHYPSHVLKDAANGPSLPGLPILTAYVRACDGDVPEWEERWRRLGFESRADLSLPVRPAGASPAAVAGARAGVSVGPPDAYDPERIRAALRGSHGRPEGDARGAVSRAGPTRFEPDTEGPATAEPRIQDGLAAWSAGTSWEETPRWDAGAQPGTGAGWDGGAQPGTSTGWDGGAQPGTGAGWDGGAQPGTSAGWDPFPRDAGQRWDDATADLSGLSANGNHHVIQPDDGSSDAAIIPAPDAARTEALRRDPFSADWLQDSDLTSPLDPASGSPEPADAGTSSTPPENWFIPRETPGPERTRSPAETEPSAAATDTWFTPRELAEPQPAEREVAPPQERSGSAPSGGTGFWRPATAATGPADVQRPGPQPAQEHAIPRASWPAAAEPPASDTPGAADRTTPVGAQASAALPSRTIAGPAVPPGPVVPPSRSRSDRLYPVRLLVVIVVAALIGSILVLLLR
jgi:hypothetical protein